MKYILFLLLFGFHSSLFSQGARYPFATQKSTNPGKLKEDFLKVPDEYKLRCWWFWMNGVATKKSISQDLAAMKAKGFGGALIADNGASIGPVGPTFMSMEWKELFAHAVKEADRLGIELALNIQSGCGDPGNPNIEPDNGIKKIVFSETKVTGPGKIQRELPVPPSQIYYEDIAVQAYRTDTLNSERNSTLKNWDIKSFQRGVPWKNEADQYDMNLFQDDFPENMKDASIDPNQIIDLTKYFSAGNLTWDVPPGEWTVIRYGMTSTGKRNDYASPGFKGGLCYDQINIKGITAHWAEVAKPLIEIAKKSGNSLQFVHLDSWEMKQTNWTHDFAVEFKNYRGYDIAPYLPVLANRVVKSREISNRFLEDFRVTIGDMVAEKNYAVLKDLAHANGVFLHSESAGPHIPPVDGLQLLGINDIPMGEFWARSNTHRVSAGRRWHVKLGSSASHIYGKRYFATEGPTSVGPVWERSPRDLKSVIDKAFCNGVNRINWHTFTASPEANGLPGIEYFAGTHFNRNVTWWDQSAAFVNYINRSQLLLTQGLYAADVLGYLGSGVPLYGFLESDRKDVPPGYAWDMCNSEVLLTRAGVDHGRIFLPDGMSYSLLALPEKKDIALPVLKKIESMVNEGIVLVGNPPQRTSGLSGYPESDRELKAIVKRLWGAIDQKSVFMNTYGKGKVYAGKTVDQVLELEGIAPDFSFTANPDVGLEYIHRSADSLEIYFVANKWARHGIDDPEYRYLPGMPDRYIDATCSFRVDGERNIERWDPLTGEITPVSIYTNENGLYHIPVSLSPEGAAFFVFKKSAKKPHINKVEKDGTVLTGGNDPLSSGASRIFVKNNQLEIFDTGTYCLTWNNGTRTTVNNLKTPKVFTLEGPWEINFLERPSLGKQVAIEIDSLKSWTEFTQRSIRYFSGTARYKKAFTLKGDFIKNGRVYLDLGNVQELATIRLNGTEVSTCWIAPFRADVTDYVKKGENMLEIDVTNLWPNRLIGDGKLPEGERKTNTNLVEDKMYRFNSADADKYLRVSGLLGPVRIESSQIFEIRR